jgi:acetylornithine/succinyldiaminopimelate/putrescine aminotransferase
MERMFRNITLSLAQILGEDYCNAVKAGAELFGMSEAEAKQLGWEGVELLDEAALAKADKLIKKTGTQITLPFKNSNAGAPTDSYRKATNLNAAPVGGIGYLRLGEDGRLYFAGKSEHYQAILGHRFNGYKLLDKARAFGLLNATHNNTRGYVTRLLEREIIRVVNGLEPSQKAELEKVLTSTEAYVLNRVINLQTGSLSCEAAFKMMLSRFYKLEASFSDRKYRGKMPVFLVMQDNDGGSQANYHGTTIFAQGLRGLWPELIKRYENAGVYKFVPVKINDIKDFGEKIAAYNSGQYKTAGFMHELVLMNYGGVVLEKEFLQKAHDLCRANDTPVMVDEIQSCMWYKGHCLFKQYGLKPDFVILGKGLAGGEFAASKVVTTAEMDLLNQFGALVTNGQEEIASLACLITIAFVEVNGNEIGAMGAKIEDRLKSLAEKHSTLLDKFEGKGHLVALNFKEVEAAVDFVKRLNAAGIDVSAQTYKANCPPAALLKFPLITTNLALDFFIETASRILGEIK